MSKKQTERLRNFYQQTIGYIETDTETGNKVGMDFYKRIVGYYNKKLDVTMDFYKRIVGRGDILASLISEANNKSDAKK